MIETPPKFKRKVSASSVSERRLSRPDVARTLVSSVRREINNWHSSRQAFRKMYLQDPHGCVPDEFVGNDLLYSIKEKFYWPLNAVREQLEKEFGNEPPLWVYVDPCYDDTTYALLTLGNEHVLFSYGSKPWTFWWKSEAEMGKELRDWYKTSRARYQKFRSLLERPSKG